MEPAEGAQPEGSSASRAIFTAKLEGLCRTEPSSCVINTTRFMEFYGPSKGRIDGPPNLISTSGSVHHYLPCGEPDRRASSYDSGRSGHRTPGKSEALDNRYRRHWCCRDMGDWPGLACHPRDEGLAPACITAATALTKGRLCKGMPATAAVPSRNCRQRKATSAALGGMPSDGTNSRDQFAR